MEISSFTIQLASKLIRINPMYAWIKEYCRDYIVETEPSQAPDFVVQTGREDIDYERIHSDRERLSANVSTDYSVSYLETLAVYRKIAEWMPMHKTLLFHGSVVSVDGKAYLFTAKSGTGKSTHTRLWREYFGERAVMVNDDKPLIQITENGIFAYGTPWDGKHRLSNNICVPLAAICILKRSENNEIYAITPSKAYPVLMQQCYRPSDKMALMETLELLDQLMEKTAFYELHCNMDIGAAKVAYNEMNK